MRDWNGDAGRGTAVVMAAAVAALSALTLLGRWDDVVPALDIPVALLSCLLAPALVRWPAAGAVVLGLLACASPAATPAATLGALAVAQHRRFPVAVTVAAVGVAAHVGQGLLRPTGGLSPVWWSVLAVIAYAALLGWGALARARWALLASLRERARRAEDDRDRRVAEARALERTRIAREMHDVLAHRLTLVATYAGALEYRPDAPPEQVARAAGVVRAGVHRALEELRDVVGVMRAGDDGEDPRPAPVLADVPRLVEEARQAGQRVEVRDAVGDRDASAAVPEAAGRAAYRVVQEASPTRAATPPASR